MNTEHFTKTMWEREIREEGNPTPQSITPPTNQQLEILDNETNIIAVLHHLDVCCISKSLNFKTTLNSFLNKI